MEKLKTIRKRKKYTQQDLATFLKISQTDYCYMENGAKEINDEQWIKLANLLEVEVEDIKEEFIKGIHQHFENISDSNYVGSHNIYDSIPAIVLENLQDYIQMLKNQIETQKNHILKLQNQVNEQKATNE